MCHEDASATAVWQGKTISLFVNKSVLGVSVHKSQKCISCHKDANVAEFPHPENLKPVVCGSCHIGYQDLVDNDLHHKLLKLGAKAPTCKICHGTHNVQSPSLITDKGTTICGKCHTDNKLSAPYHTKTIVETNCMSCHKKQEYKSLLAKSVHKDLSCANCHGYVIQNFEKHRTLPESEAITGCYLCHADIAAQHKESIHGISLAEGVSEAAQCWDCHGTHNILKVTNEKSKVYPTNLANTCAVCHDKPGFSEKYSSVVKQPGLMYASSVHGKLVSAGSKNAPTCATCHGIHNIKNRVQPGSTISGFELPNTCGKCHEKVAKEYKESIHWVAVKKGVRNAPSCNDCHSEHDIQSVNTADKRNAIKQLQDLTCLECHQNLLLAKRYGMKEGNAKSYQDSYHGMAVLRGDEKAAMCIDCHGVHSILPKSNPKSTIYKENIVATCKKCHPDASDTFASSYSHITEAGTAARSIEDLVGNIYFWLIIVVVGFMIAHNLIIFIHDIRERYKINKNVNGIQRFTKNELVQHLVLFISFAVLAITGFELKYPESWWSHGLSYLGLDEVTRRYVHRGAAVVMIALSLYHVAYLLAVSRGRAILRSLLPKLSDFNTAFKNIMYYLRLRKKSPDFDYYNYIEKVEYWALIWGTIIMGVTGIFLWFPTIVGNWAPVWFIKVCEIIHFYEAVLATLAILIWHWFFVVFRPKEYPLNFAFVNGKMSIHHFKEEHAAAYRKMILEWAELKAGKKAQKKISNLTKAFITAVEKSGQDTETFMMSEISNDEELRSLTEGWFN